MFAEEGARFSPQQTRNRSNCCVQGCNSKASRNLTVRFHSFPKTCIDFVNIIDDYGINKRICRRQAWEQILLTENIKITNNTRVCSLHFRRSDYILPDAPTQKRYLKRDAVPSCNLPMVQAKRPVEEIAKNGIRIENNSKGPLKMAEPYDFVLVKSEVMDFEINTEALSSEAIVELDHCYTISTLAERQHERFAIKEEPIELSLVKIEPPDTESYDYEEQTTSSGALAPKQEPVQIKIETESIDIPEIYLNSNIEEVWQKSNPKERENRREKIYQEDRNGSETASCESKFLDMLKSDRALYVMSGIPSHKVLKIIVERVKSTSPRLAKAQGLELTIVDRVIMTFTKLKQGLSYAVLAIFFRCSSKKACKRIVLRTLDVLNDCLGCFIHWPPPHKLKTHCSEEDSRKISNFRCIVNRIEFATRKSSTSLHKRCVKFVTAVTTNGAVCFIGKASYGETHKIAFERSNIVELLTKNDAILILKDFPIDDYCQENQIHLVRSLFSNNQNNLTISTDYRNRLNVNRRIHTFRIFRRKLTPSLCSRTRNILVAICAVDNLHKSIFDRRKINVS